MDIWLAIFELSCYAAWLVVGFSIDRIFWHILECCNLVVLNSPTTSIITVIIISLNIKALLKDF
ncbi:MAG: hypothetical protein AB8V10_04785 [Francisella endosymbiont of Hyalomma asiaticum]